MRLVNTQNVFGRLINLNRRFHYSFIALVEPFQDPDEIYLYKIRLGFGHAAVNYSGKIWIFWHEDWAGSIVINSYQQVTMKFLKGGKEFMITSVYARCITLDILELQDELENLDFIGCPWMVGEDFNVILKEDDKLGGLNFIQQKAMDFAQYMNSCALNEIPFTGASTLGGMKEEMMLVSSKGSIGYL